MSGNVGGRGTYDAIKENTAAINTAEANRAKDSFKLRDMFGKALVQLRIINKHQEKVSDEVFSEKDLDKNIDNRSI